MAPAPFEDPGRSRDLGQMAEFDRELLLAENYYSEAYLRDLARLVATFPVEKHRVVRRAIHTPQGRYVFEGDRPTEEPSSDPAAREAVLEWFRGYVAGIEGRALIRFTEGDHDPERIESLRALGYVGEED